MEDKLRQEVLQTYKDNIKWLRHNVPMDDIYEFTEQIIMCSECFLNKINTTIDLYKELENDSEFARWVNSLAEIRQSCKNKKPDRIIVKEIRFRDL